MSESEFVYTQASGLATDILRKVEKIIKDDNFFWNNQIRWSWSKSLSAEWEFNVGCNNKSHTIRTGINDYGAEPWSDMFVGELVNSIAEEAAAWLLMVRKGRTNDTGG